MVIGKSCIMRPLVASCCRWSFLTGDGTLYVCMHAYIHIHIYMFVVVNFDALAQASDIQIERRQVVFLCCKQDLNPGPQTPIRQQTECSLTNLLSYDQRAFSPLGPTAYIHACMHACVRTYVRTYIHTYIHTHTHIHTHIHAYLFVVVNFDALAQASDIRIERRQVVFLC